MQCAVDTRELFERFQDDRAFLSATIAMYLEACDRDLRELGIAVEERDVERVARTAHKIKGSVSVFAAADALASAAALERAGREQKSAALAPAFAALLREIERLKLELSALRTDAQ